MVRRLWLVTLLFASPLYAATLQLQLDTTEIELGKFIAARIIYRGNQTPGDIDLSLWQDDFFIDRNDAEVSSSDDGSTLLEISARLYPRHRGELVLEAIALGGAIAPPTHVRVRAPVRNHIDITPRLQPLKDFYWADQPILIHIDVPLHDARNEVIAADFSADYFDITRLPDERIKSGQEQIIRLRWIVSSPRNGHYKIELPVITQRGRGRFRFHLPPIELQIKPLPAYLSPSLIVGRPTLDIHTARDRQWQHFLHLKITHQGRLPQQAQGIADLFAQLGVDELAIDARQYSQNGNTIQQYRLELPRWLTPRQAHIELGYFDTERGQYAVLHEHSDWLWNAPRYLLWLAIFIATGGLFYLFNRLDRLATRWRRRKQLRQQVKQAESATQLRRLLLDSSQRQSLQSWSELFAEPLARQIAQQLNRACFASAPQQPLDEIKQACLKLLSSGRRTQTVHFAMPD